MGSEFNWFAIDSVFEFLSVTNWDDCIYALTIIRDFSNKLREQSQ